MNTVSYIPFAKSIIRLIYKQYQTLIVLFVTLIRRSHSIYPFVFYGGARSGDIGGPLVKVQRLVSRYPEHKLSFNLVYSLSNCPYLTKGALKRFEEAIFHWC